MNIRLLSDLHIEFKDYPVDKLYSDSDTILILAGDIGLLKHAILFEFIENLSQQFYKIIYIAGNHEFYSSVLYGAFDKFKASISHLENVHCLEKETLVVDDILFIGATTWTSFRGGNPITMMQIGNGLNDYRKIRHGKVGYRKIIPTDILHENQKARNFIFNTLEKKSARYRKTVVITHHAPSYKSLPEKWKYDSLNDAFVDNLDVEILKYNPHMWLHGHIHESMDYMLGDTRIVANPKGYPTNMCGRGGPEHENINFNPILSFKL